MVIRSMFREARRRERGLLCLWRYLESSSMVWSSSLVVVVVGVVGVFCLLSLWRRVSKMEERLGVGRVKREQRESERKK